MAPSAPARIELHLVDGRVFTFTDAAEVFTLIDALHLTRADIRETRHIISREEWDARVPAITCPRCGRRSYHRTDIAERYCGACHLFHDEMHMQGGQREPDDRGPAGPAGTKAQEED